MSEYTFKQLKEMSPVQLERLASQLRHQVQTLSFQSGLSELKQVHKIRQARRTLARVLTLCGRTAAEPSTKDAAAKKA